MGNYLKLSVKICDGYKLGINSYSFHLSSSSPFPSYLFSSPHCFLLPMPQTPWRSTQDAGRFPSLKEFADLETKFAL